MEFVQILVISTINVFAISISSTFFLIKGYDHIILEKVIAAARKSGDSPETEPIIREQMKFILKRFYISFIILEISLIFYFVFWCSLLYLKTKV